MKPFSLRYLYSGYDGYTPEVLDFGCYDFENNDWANLFLSFSNKLKQIAKEKLPPFSQLETFLIPPAEMAVQSPILSFRVDYDIAADWDDWELSQALAEEKEGYSSEFLEAGRGYDDRLRTCTAAAVRNRHISAINETLKANSMFLSGIFLPQILWKDFIEGIKGPDQEICLLYREDNSHLFIHHSSSAFPRLKWYQQRKSDEKRADKIENEVIINLAENLTYSLPVGNNGAHLPLYFFQDSFSREEKAALENILQVNLLDIPGDYLPERLYSPGQIEYLMPYCAHKKISDSIVLNRIIRRT